MATPACLFPELYSTYWGTVSVPTLTQQTADLTAVSNGNRQQILGAIAALEREVGIHYDSLKTDLRTVMDNQGRIHDQLEALRNTQVDMQDVLYRLWNAYQTTAQQVQYICDTFIPETRTKLQQMDIFIRGWKDADDTRWGQSSVAEESVWDFYDTYVRNLPAELTRIENLCIQVKNTIHDQFGWHKSQWRGWIYGFNAIQAVLMKDSSRFWRSTINSPGEREGYDMRVALNVPSQNPNVYTDFSSLSTVGDIYAGSTTLRLHSDGLMWYQKSWSRYAPFLVSGDNADYAYYYSDAVRSLFARPYTVDGSYVWGM